MVKGASWLSITPEPERELPHAVVTLLRGVSPAPEEVDAEQARVEQLVLHGSQRAWLRYLHRVVELIDQRADDPDPEVQHARALATAVISNHHNLLLALPGRGAEITAADRTRLGQLEVEHHEPKGHT